MPEPSSSLPFSINLRRVNKGVGYVALLLPVWLLLVTIFTETCFNASISHYYFSRLGGDILVGSLTFIGLLLLFFYSMDDQQVDGYLEHRSHDGWLARIAGLSAFMIAYSPTTGSGCAYNGHEVARVFLTNASGADDFLPNVPPVAGTIGFDFWATFPNIAPDSVLMTVLHSIHFAGAAAMFLILGYFSYFVFTRKNTSHSHDEDQAGTRKARRNAWYRGLGILIFTAVIALGMKSALPGLILSEAQQEALQAWWDARRLTFVFESLALMSFGLSWMIKGRFLDFFEDERVLEMRLQERAA